MSRQIEINNLIIKHQRRLQKLKEKKARLGISTPPETLIEIEDIEAELKNLETELQGLAAGNRTSPEQNHYPNESDRESDLTQETASPFAQFIANLLILGILIYLFYGKAVVNCVPNWVSAFSSAIIAIIIFHILWHYLYPVFTLSGKFSLFGFEIDFKSLLILLDTVHPRYLSVFVLWGAMLVLIPSASIIGYTNLSPFILEDPIPIIENFTVTDLETRQSKVLKGNAIEIGLGEQILIEVTVSQQAGFQCNWFTTNGKLQTATECAVIYSPNFNAKPDTLVVLIQSLCQEKQTFVGVHISVLQTPP